MYFKYIRIIVSIKKERHYYYPNSDEINLIRAWIVLFQSKYLLIAITTVFTIMGGAYAYLSTPIYESTALIEIGSYNNIERNSTGKIKGKIKKILASEAELSTRLSVLFIEKFKYEKGRTSKIISIKPPKKTKNFILIESEAISNQLAKKEIQKVVDYIKEKHNTILIDLKSRVTYEIQLTDLQINKTLPKQAEVFANKIKIKQTELIKTLSLVDEVIKNIKEIETLNPALTATMLIDKNNLLKKILNLKLEILNEKNEINNINDIEIPKLIQEKKNLQSALLPHNYQNTDVVGNILINNSPSKPKKKLIVIASFITGGLVSIFIIFFINALRREKESSKLPV